MKIFLSGATGYIGGSVAERLLREGHAITGLVRTESGAKELQTRGIRAMLGSLDDSNVIARASHEADAVIDTAEANHAGVVEAIASALRGSGKPFLHTSGSGIVATVTNGERSDSIYDEYSRFTPTIPRMQQRAAIDQVVFDAAKHGVREALKNVAASISRMLGFGGKTREWSLQEAEAALGPKAHSSFGSNSRVRGKRSRAELGWQPKGVPLVHEIERGYYRRIHRSG